MPHNRYYLPKNFYQDEVVTLEEKESKHLNCVMRAKVSEFIELVNGKGYLAKASICSISKKQIHAQIQNIHYTPLPSKKIILIQALCKDKKRFEWLLEKSCELGAEELWFFKGDNSPNYPIKESFFQRLQSISIAAIKQSGNLHLPKYKVMPPIEKWPAFTSPCFFGELDPQSPPLDRLMREENIQDSCAVIIGPEGGFSHREQEQIKKLGAKGVSLHPYTLRFETAAVTALAIISHHFFTKTPN